jgi:hypothetical protein
MNEYILLEPGLPRYPFGEQLISQIKRVQNNIRVAYTQQRKEDGELKCEF